MSENLNTLNDTLVEYRKISFSERDKGDRFERLMQAYLKTDPKYAYRFKHIWLIDVKELLKSNK